MVNGLSSLSAEEELSLSAGSFLQKEKETFSGVFFEI